VLIYEKTDLLETDSKCWKRALIPRMNVLRPSATLAVGFLLAHGTLVEAAEIRVVSLPAYASLLGKLNPVFATTAGHELVIESGLFSQLKARIDAGDFDVAFSSGPITDYLAKQGRIVPSQRIEFSRVGISVAVPAGSPKPDIASVSKFMQVLHNARSISIPPKESTAGDYLISLFDRLSVIDDLKSKLKISSGGLQTPKALAAGEADLGISLASEFVHVSGVQVVGPLPPELQLYVIQTAAVGVTAKEPGAAATLVKYLSTPAAIALIKAEGFEPIAKR
jgi:molybdate transport system substrate-binding protein